MLDRLPLPDGGQSLDAPCGNGFYAERLGQRGTVAALDNNPAYLEEARKRLGTLGDRAHVVAGDVYALDFPAETFDLVFCGQSLITLDNPERVLVEFHRVLRPGGVLAIFETDEFHHVLLPWPVGLEVAMHSALHEASHAKYGTGAKLAATRAIVKNLRAAGFRVPLRKTIAMDRVAPFRKADRRFLRRHLQFLKELVQSRLPTEQLERYEAFTSRSHAESFFRSDSAEFTCLGALYLGRK